MVQNLPDGEILARTWALSKTSITDLVQQKIATRLPTGSDMPFIVIQMLGGSPLGGESLIYQAQLVVDFYAGKYATNSTKGQPDYSSAFSVLHKKLMFAQSYLSSVRASHYKRCHLQCGM